jgi:two-component system, chemotaxis family, chemotaxis protein CheY
MQRRRATVSRKKILVVDDSATVRQQVSMALGQAGYDVIEAADGQYGLEAVEGNADLTLVICDVNMPRMNGLDMLAAVKRDPRHARLPILMLTTEGQPALMKKAKESGAKGWIVKPFDPTQLVAAVNKLTSL